MLDNMISWSIARPEGSDYSGYIAQTGWDFALAVFKDGYVTYKVYATTTDDYKKDEQKGGAVLYLPKGMYKRTQNDKEKRLKLAIWFEEHICGKIIG